MSEDRWSSDDLADPVPPELQKTDEALRSGRPLLMKAVPTAAAVQPKVRLADIKNDRVMDNMGVRIARVDGNRLKLFCAKNRFSLGEAVRHLLDLAGVKDDGSIDTPTKTNLT